ncbi:hypothetical protein BDF22DRAFT_743696 [Syncephalis plumigaleata]|nr:hypothetical protein BDF22DRAFT_743696 [Syncephalis plumigaleata]
MNQTAAGPVTTFFGLIRLNPLGEISPLDFLEQSTSIDDARTRFSTNGKTAIVGLVIGCVFFSNTWRALRLVYARPSNIPYWCCFLQAFMGILLGLGFLTGLLTSFMTCRRSIWIAASGLTISSICTTICLLSKAYMVQMRDKRILWIGIAFISLAFINVWAIMFQCEMTFTVEEACVAHYPTWFPISRGCIDLLINCLFSSVFLRVVIRQYKIFGSKCWDKLKSEGIFYLLCVTTSNLTCAILTMHESLGPLREMLFLADWLVVSTLLVHQNQRMRTVFRDHQPRTRHHTLTTEEVDGFIHLNPLGEISALNFISQSEDLRIARLRLASSNKQMFIDIIIVYIFVQSSWKMLHFLRSRLRNPVYWCCFIQAFVGIMYGITAMLSRLSGISSCRMTVWMGAIGLTMYNICMAR